MMLKILNLVFGALNVSILLVLLCLLWQGYWVPSVGPTNIEYKDFVSILLTALGLMIAILAAIAAVAAFWGFETTKREAVAAAKD